MITNCEICGRINECNEHHLIPKTNHTNKWFKKRHTKEELNKTILICKSDCHKNLHKLIPNEKDLGKFYNTIEKLLENEKFKNYVEWIKKKDTGLELET